MIRIDILGPTGIGKSTLLQNITRKSSDIIISELQALKIAALKEARNRPFLKSVLLKLLLEFPISNRKIYDFVLANKPRDLLWQEQDRYNLFLINIINYLQIEKEHSVITLERLKYLYDTIKNLIIIEKYINKKIVIFESSLSLRFISLIIPLKKKEYIFNNTTKYFLFPNGIINLYGSVNSVLKRLYNREGYKDLRSFTVRGMTSEQIAKWTETVIHLNRKICEIAEKRNIPVLQVNMDYPLDEKIGIINEFIKKRFLRELCV